MVQSFLDKVLGSYEELFDPDRALRQKEKRSASVATPKESGYSTLTYSQSDHYISIEDGYDCAGRMFVLSAKCMGQDWARDAVSKGGLVESCSDMSAERLAELIAWQEETYGYTPDWKRSRKFYKTRKCKDNFGQGRD